MARIYEKDIPKVIDAMQQLLAATSSPIPNTGLAEDEVNLLREHRRQKQLTLLKNCGIDIASAPHHGYAGMTYPIDKLRSILSYGLIAGLGLPKPGALCLEAAVSLALGEPHGDKPSCVARAVRAFGIGLNDSPRWSSPQARAQGLSRFAVAQLGSVGLDRTEFARRLAEQVIRRVVPIALRAVGLHAEAERCEQEGTEQSARDAADAVLTLAADADADAAARYAARYAAGAADAAAAARSAAAAARSAYTAARSAAAAARSAYTTDADAADAVLTLAAECAVTVLCDMGSPGCAYLTEPGA